MQKKPFALIIFGPTAVGKTSFALQLAQNIPAEIVNGDSAQVYTPLSVGTAKPDWKNEPVPHHLFDIIDEPRDFSVVEYRQKLIATVNDIFSRGKVPIIVGGSGFYLKSLFFLVSTETSSEKNTHGKDFSWEKLYEVDPERAKKIQKNDTYRINRALSIWYNTGKKPSEFVPIYDPPFNFLLCYLTRDRQQLYKRINTRTHQMVQEGWLQEVKDLHQTEWKEFLYRKKFIGYDVLLEHLAGAISLDEAVALIQQRTRHYAKRQATFWKTFQRQLDDATKEYSKNPSSPIRLRRTGSSGQTELVNLTLLDRDLYIKQLLKRLRVHIN